VLLVLLLLLLLPLLILGHVLDLMLRLLLAQLSLLSLPNSIPAPPPRAHPQCMHIIRFPAPPQQLRRAALMPQWLRRSSLMPE
jgi:hypothetical protein